MRKLFSYFVLLAAGLLISGNIWANYVMPEIEAKPAPEISENVTLAEEVVPTVNIASEDAAPQRIAKSPMEVTVHPVSSAAELTQALTNATAGDEIKLTADITLTSGITIAKQLTLNLGGKTLSGGVNNLITITGGPLTIVGNSEGETPLGTITSSYTSTSYYGVVVLLKASELLFTSGTISTTAAYPRAINVAGGGKVTIGENANISCEIMPSYNAGHIYNATDGASFENSSTIDLFNTARAAIINHGTLNVRGAGSYGANSITNDGTITFYDGTFDSSLKDFVEAHLAPNLVLVKTALSGIEVYMICKSGTKMVASVGDYQYPTLLSALQESSQETPTVILENCSVSTTTLSSGNAYLDLNGKVIDFGSGYIKLNGTATLTVLDNSEEHTGQIKSSQTYGAFDIYKGATLNLFGGWVNCTNYYGIYLNPGSSSETGGYCTVNIDGEYTKVTALAYGVAIMDYNHFTMNNGLIETDGYTIVNNGNVEPTVMNINGGTILSSGECIYHPGRGTLTITGGELIGGSAVIEMRAGDLNISGGKFISTWEASESESWGNGNGATTVGAAIAVAQHTTQYPINVTITGGDFEGIIPVKLANPQNNPAASINQVNVAINGGRYKVVNGAGAPFWSITDNFTVSAGKFSHVPAYVVAGKTVVPNTGEDKNIYPWAIGEVNANPITPTGITWQTGTDWPNDQVPTSQDKVTLTTSQNIVVSGSSEEVAQAYSITIPTGATLTVESGATLVVGGGGITSPDNNTLKVEPGAQVYISPDADLTSLYGRVAFTPNVGKYAPEEVGTWYDMPNRYQLMGVPTKGVPAVTKNKDDGDGFKLNKWDVMNGWEAAAIADFTPFKGFFFWNDVPVNDDAPDLVTYYFKGELFGNKPQTLVFTENEGFHLFANSYLAEVDILALIQGAEENVAKAVYVYDPVQERFLDISYATYGKPGVPTAIQPMQGFYFLNQHNGTTTSPMDYVSMVWSNAFKVEQEFVSDAPARQQSEQMTEVRVSLTDNVKGRNDGVYLMEREEVNEDANIRKMMNPATSVNVYVANENTQLSQMQTTNLDGQALTITTNTAISYTFSFDWVQGEQYYLNDAVTGISTPMSEGNTYTFTAQPNSTITGRFTVVRYAPSVVTDIQMVDAIPAVKGIYTIAGQYVGNEQAWESLPAGVYIVNGEKMVK